jgi:sterol desaturase/sphingolipid hydroxylase (fatty acid hydroxylase superfamily)
METIINNLIDWSIPILLTLLITEWAYSKLSKNKKLYEWRDFLVSSFMSVGTLILNPLLKFISAATIFHFTYEWFNPELNGIRTNLLGYQSFGWAWYTWVVCQFLDDFTHYWFHRLNHTVRIMWAAHVVHHSSQHFNYGTALRLSWISIADKPLFYMWMPMIGFHPEMVLVCLAIEAIWQFLLHTTYFPKLKYFNKIFITPREHQVHHGKNLEYLDKNHGAILTLFDKVFGSWKDLDEKIPIEYGITKGPKSYNPITIITHEYKSIWKDIRSSNSIYEAIMYVFGPPGWSPNGDTLTVKQLQKKSISN